MLAFAYTYFMRVPAVNKALHESVRGCSYGSLLTPAPQIALRGVLFNHKKDKGVCYDY